MGEGKRAKREKSAVKKKKNWGLIILITILVLLVIVAGILLALKVFNKGQAETTVNEQDPEVIEPQVQIVDVNSKTRPYAVMINNNHAAWPQCGLQDAYLVYEIIAEGGITRMMALYKDVYPEKIGSVRSARHYFIDYAEENDAIYIHWGGSPQAYSRLGSVDDLDGIALENVVFFRDRTLNRAYEHTGFANLEKIKEYSEDKGYTRDTTKDLLLNYSAEEVDLSSNIQAKAADKITLKYSYYHTTSYEYDAENKVYKRSMSGEANVDLETGEQYTAKNIIVYKVRNYTLNDGENKGRQELDNIGSGTGYYISNGYSVPITWEKSTHSGQTVYKYENGEEITVNDGNTFIQICPTDANISIEQIAKTTETENTVEQ